MQNKTLMLPELQLLSPVLTIKIRQHSSSGGLHCQDRFQCLDLVSFKFQDIFHDFWGVKDPPHRRLGEIFSDPIHGHHPVLVSCSQQHDVVVDKVKKFQGPCILSSDRGDGEQWTVHAGVVNVTQLVAQVEHT